MPPKGNKRGKKDDRKQKKPKTLTTQGIGICPTQTPGPKYKLHTLTEYNRHCLSKYRNPAYSLGARQIIDDSTPTPGPKYRLAAPRQEGFSFGYPKRNDYSTAGPGPKYRLPTPPIRPGFFLKSRVSPRKGDITPIGYNLKSTLNGPSYTMGFPATGIECAPGPAHHDRPNLNAVKPRAPIYSIAYKQDPDVPCVSPGPKYNPSLAKSSPLFSFGTRHSPCAPPYFVECDDHC